MGDGRERTFIMIKPDGVQRGLVGKIISRFEKKGFKLIAMKFMQVINLIKANRLLPLLKIENVHFKKVYVLKKLS